MRMVRFQGIETETAWRDGELAYVAPRGEHAVAVDADRVVRAHEGRVHVGSQMKTATWLALESDYVATVLGSLGETLERLSMGQK